MNEKLNDKEKTLVTELLSYAKMLSNKNLEHLVWIGEGMYHATKKEKSQENKNEN